AFHYETQPLPTPLSWEAHQLPMGFHKLSTAVMFGVELVAPFLIFAPQPFRAITALLFVGLMVLIELTGNYCFFNLLTIALSILLVDDKILLAAWHYVCGQDLEPLLLHSAPRWLNGVAVVLAVLIGFLSLAPMLRLFRYEINWSNPLVNVFAFFEPFRLV